MKLTIGKKIAIGYIPIILLLITISLFTLFRLNQVNRINNEIVSLDLAVNNVAQNLVEILLAQESYCQRYMILKSQDMLSLFWKRDQEFSANYDKIQKLPSGKQTYSLASLEQYHAEYNKYFVTSTEYLDSIQSSSFMLADSLRKNAFTQQITHLNTLVAESRSNQIKKTQQTAEISRITFRMISLISLIGIIFVVGIAGKITQGIRHAIKTLKTATDFVSQGSFKNLPTVHNADELGDLSVAFNEMATRLLQLEEIYMDSSPLTRLPGGIAIENTVKKRIESNEPFAFCLFDLDNFKPFNDRYGYSRGNAVIKNTANIILESSKELGEKTDFVGHIGGDDFVLITGPDKFTATCNKVIELFDKQILEFYNPEDRQQGFISSKNRQGKKLSFPIMTISIAAMNSEKTLVENYIEVGEIIAELKKYAKSFKKSNLAIDRRGGKKQQVIQESA